ncbi:MAG: periplasmic heavy metal sensor [Myxococcales bacterium]|nr:periplasmic heavy metal sensor [Myxococcales bacterium]
MICLAIGIGLLGVAAMRRARHCHGHGGHHYQGWRGWHGHHGHHGRRNWMLNAALARIDATPAQERVIVGEIEKLQERMYGARTNLKAARGDLAAAIRGPMLDDAALGAVLGQVDASTGEARSAMIDALRNVHAVLDDRQRATVGDLIDRNGGGFWRRGPYR